MLQIIISALDEWGCDRQSNTLPLSPAATSSKDVHILTTATCECYRKCQHVRVNELRLLRLDYPAGQCSHRVLLALEMEAVIMSQRKPTASRSWTRKEADSTLELLGGMMPSWHLDFSPGRLLISDHLSH